MNTYFVYAKDVFDSFVYRYYLTNLNGDKLILAPIEMVIGAFIIGVIVKKLYFGKLTEVSIMQSYAILAYDLGKAHATLAKKEGDACTVSTTKQ